MTLKSVAGGLLFLLLQSASIQSATLHDHADGGKDIRVLLFSTTQLHDLTLTPLSPDAWISRCARCNHTLLKSPLRLSGNFEVFAGGSIRVKDDGSDAQRSASGLWHVRSIRDGIDVVLTLPSERYVAAVLNAEGNGDEPPEAMRALAIVARTYALNGSHAPASADHLVTDTCDSTECQAMRLGPVSAAMNEAVRETSGETLWFRGERAQVFFSEHCGGRTAATDEVWTGGAALPYLVSQADPYCLRRSAAAWHAEVPMKDFHAIAEAQSWRLPRDIHSAQIIERGTSGRPLKIEFLGKESQRGIVDAGALRFAIDRALGWNRIRGSQFNVAINNGALIFDGRGYGHGVGLCQTGAAEMAAENKTAEQILSFYFPGTTVGITPSDSGWRSFNLGAVKVFSTDEISPDQRDQIVKTWSHALQLFPPRHALTPEITIAPSVELFRQLTLQPGWIAASTSGQRIVVSPYAWEREHFHGTLLHEFLHVQVESESTARTPLWLREGLVAEMTEESRSHEIHMSPANIDAALLHATTQIEDERAHRAAASLVHELIQRYGCSTVRSWLMSGVPAGVA